MGLCTSFCLLAMRKIAISACLLGQNCRYDGTDNKNTLLITQLKDTELIPFCPEDYAFGTPRPTMDLVRTKEGIAAISNGSGENLSTPIQEYASIFFDRNPDIDLIIGKDRSPSCGVCSTKLYDGNRNLLSHDEAGLMIQEAKKRNILCIDAENFKGL